MLDYADEIKARPARTWFQTERQKQELKKKVAQMTAEGREDVEDDEVRAGALRCRRSGFESLVAQSCRRL